MDGKASDRRKFVLRKTGGFAQRPESRPEGTGSVTAHHTILCERVTYGSLILTFGNRSRTSFRTADVVVRLSGIDVRGEIFWAVPQLWMVEFSERGNQR
jgi:hypothetical protein